MNNTLKIKEKMIKTTDDFIYKMRKQLLSKRYVSYRSIKKDIYLYLKHKMVFSKHELFTKLDNYFSEIFLMLKMDLKSFIDGDPAAKNKEEIIVIYPGFLAIIIYRFANVLHRLDLDLWARVASEYSHSLTGIDINPKALIGTNFFIDHGTGIVIGETTTIGNYVKIYQGATLGAISLSKGHKLKGIKRHPSIGNNVTIYAGSSILGGNTIIGDNVIIGVNTIITDSISPNKIVKSNYKGNEIIPKNLKNG